MPKPVDLSDLMAPSAAASPTGVDLSDLISGGPTPSAADQALTHHDAMRTLNMPSVAPVGGRAGAAVRSATRGVLPTVSAAMGASTGAEVGMLGGPLAEITVPAGALIGGGLGYWAGKKAQQSVMDNVVPQGALKVMGQDPASVKLDQQTYPVTSALSESIPSLIGGGALQRAMTDPAIADIAMLTPKPKPGLTPSRADVINATRAAAERQGVSLPTTLTSPTGYAVSRAIPKVFGGSAIETAESAAPQAVGKKLSDLAATYLKPTEPGDAAQVVQDSAAQWAEKQRLSGGALITSAGEKAQGIPLAPTSTLNYIDSEIERLQANPIANNSKIRMLAGIKGDLSNPGNPLDLNSLHDLRASLYANAVPEGLSASAAAKTRGDLWNTLSDDIQTGLGTASERGNEKAADALSDFNNGTSIWKNRQATIQSTLGKILGSSASENVGDPTRPLFVADMAPEKAASAINDMVTGNRRGVQTLMGTLDDDAKDTVRASVIASLGRDGAGNFSAPIFLKQMKSIPDVTRDTLFGAQHAASLDDLETIVTNIGQAQPRHGGFGAYGVELALGSLLGLHGGAMHAGEGIAAVTGGNMVAAHLLAQPDTLKWLGKLSNAVQSGNTVPVVAKLATAARSSPALASLYDTVQQTSTNLMNAPQKVPKDKAQPEIFDPSKMTDEELRAGLPQQPAEAPAAPEHVTLDPAAYPNKPLEDLIPAVAKAESGGDAHAVSPKGAEGLFQAMPATQTDPGFGVKPVADNSLAEKSRVGEDYLHAMLNRYGGQQVLGLLAHNWGAGNVDKWIAGGMKGSVPKESRDYVEKILGGGSATN